jgi:8-oxo-dGTP pyrophosphatase MutT (NUDIX family)
VPNAGLAYNAVVLPEPPAHTVVVDEELEYGGEGFVQLHRRRCRLRYASGEQSPPFTYDAAERKSFDAAVIVPHFDVGGEPWVALRSCIRPPIAFRALKFADAPELTLTNLWELPAGLIDEPGEVLAAARACAARELHEETGFAASAMDFTFLGGATFPLPGVIAERQYFLAVNVHPSDKETPGEDGSPLEGHGEVVFVSLAEALEACRDGRICDGKTELGLRRFEEAWRARR